MRSDLFVHGYLWAFVSVFVGGFLTSLTPCVYPLIPITVGIFGAKKAETSRARATLLAATYVGGIGVMYSSLGIFSALAGRAFGGYMASPWAMVPIALLFLAMAASMFGAFELQLPSSMQQRLTGLGGEGFGGAFLMGLVGGLIAAPCTGPVLASVLAYVSTTRSVLLGASMLFTYALGMGVLFFAIAAFAVGLPRLGGRMEWVKTIFGVIMIVAALYFLRNVSPALRDWGKPALWFLGANVVLVIAGIAVGAIHLSFASHRGHQLRKSLGILALSAGAFGSVGWALAPKEPAAGAAIVWSHDAGAIDRALADHRPTVIDFYADWCLPCKELDLKTFSNENVRRDLARFSLHKVDCTHDDDPKVDALKQRFGADTLPSVVIIDSKGTIVTRIDHFVEPAELQKALARAE